MDEELEEGGAFPLDDDGLELPPEGMNFDDDDTEKDPDRDS